MTIPYHYNSRHALYFFSPSLNFNNTQHHLTAFLGTSPTQMLDSLCYTCVPQQNGYLLVDTLKSTMQFPVAAASHEASRNSFSTTVTSYNPSRYEDVKLRNTNPANSATEYSSTISQYGEFYGIKRKPLAFHKKKSSGRQVKKINSGYERDPLFMTQEQRVKGEDQYWRSIFGRRKKTFCLRELVVAIDEETKKRVGV